MPQETLGLRHHQLVATAPAKLNMTPADEKLGQLCSYALTADAQLCSAS